MAEHIALVCVQCGGKLVKNNDIWHCEHCGTDYVLNENKILVEVSNPRKFGKEFEEGRMLAHSNKQEPEEHAKAHSTGTLVLAVLVTALLVGLITTRIASTPSDQDKPQITDSSAQEKGAEPDEIPATNEDAAEDAASTDTVSLAEDNESPTNANESEATTEPKTEPASKYADLLGTWTGKLQPSPEEVYCYGAEKMPLVLMVKEATELDKITADIHACQHNHYELQNSASATEGDEYLELNNVVMKYNDGVLRYSHDFDGKYSDSVGPQLLSVEFRISGLESGTPEISAEVYSMYGHGIGHCSYQTDLFELEKTA